MNKQTQESVNEVLPRTRFFSQAALEEIAVDFSQGHDYLNATWLNEAGAGSHFRVNGGSK